MNIDITGLVLTYEGDEGYLPAGIRENTEYAVIGFDSRQRRVTFSDSQSGKTQRKEKVDIFFYVINDNGKVTRIIDSNAYLKKVPVDDLPF